MSTPVIIYLWSNQSPASTKMLDDLIRHRLTSLHSMVSTVNPICMDNKEYRNIVLGNKSGVNASVVPCFLVTIERDGDRVTTVIDRSEDMDTFIRSLLSNSSSNRH